MLDVQPVHSTLAIQQPKLRPLFTFPLINHLSVHTDKSSTAVKSGDL